MSKLEEIERAVEQLPLDQFAQFAMWLDRRRSELATTAPTLRDHTAFLNSYAAQDEGLYDDVASR
jgi:hypothetical protein